MPPTPEKTDPILQSPFGEIAPVTQKNESKSNVDKIELADFKKVKDKNLHSDSSTTLKSSKQA